MKYDHNGIAEQIRAQIPEWTRRRTAVSFADIIGRQTVFDSLEPKGQPCRYAVSDMDGRVLESRQLPPGCDPKLAFIAAMLEHIAGKWDIGEFDSRAGKFLCTRGTQRRTVSITPTARGSQLG
jgi:hypothetical protein